MKIELTEAEKNFLGSLLATPELQLRLSILQKLSAGPDRAAHLAEQQPISPGADKVEPPTSPTSSPAESGSAPAGGVDGHNN